MWKICATKVIVLLVGLFLLNPGYGQSETQITEKYLSNLSEIPFVNAMGRYKMTAIYSNLDLYGKFLNKTQVTGEYTRGFSDGTVKWNNVSIAVSTDKSSPFKNSSTQEYMEDMTYIPSPKMLEPESFIGFPSSPDGVFAKNLVWDMMAIEGFAFDHLNTLELNKVYYLDAGDKFQMADVGNYSHSNIQIQWTGISAINGKLFALIEYRAIDNTLELFLPEVKTKGTEQYWGTIWVSMSTRQIGYADMYGGSIQEITVASMPKPFIIKTVRELWVEKI